ncbi:hypothetical protein [Nonomuraea salmonea]|uniref:hypothetical protein n=1 Tax=Nonomuraea salmonea TaxID=46181 RepID=UPI002FECE72C
MRPAAAPGRTARPLAGGAGELLVRVLAAPITPLDVLCAGGASYFGAPATPYVPGVQGVGTVGGRLVWFPHAGRDGAGRREHGGAGLRARRRRRRAAR